jgi:hypothetical protein
MSTQKNINPPIKFAIILEMTVPKPFKNIKHNANNGVDNCHLNKYKQYFLNIYNNPFLS